MLFTIFLLFGLSLFALSIYLFMRSVTFLKNGNRAAATVVDLETHRDSDDGTMMYKPIFKFTTDTNQEIIYRHVVSSSSPSFEIGQEVELVYDPKNPNDVKLLTYFNVFLWSIVLMNLSLPFIVVCGGYFLTKPLLN